MSVILIGHFEQSQNNCNWLETRSKLSRGATFFLLWTNLRGLPFHSITTTQKYIYIIVVTTHVRNILLDKTFTKPLVYFEGLFPQKRTQDCHKIIVKRHTETTNIGTLHRSLGRNLAKTCLTTTHRHTLHRVVCKNITPYFTEPRATNHGGF